MKYFFLLFFIFSASIYGNGQSSNIDSLNHLLEKTPPDTNRVKLLLQLSGFYYFSKPDSSLIYSDSAVKLSRQLNFFTGEIIALNNAGESLRFLGDYPKALKMQMQALELNRNIKNKTGEAITMAFIGLIYVQFKEYRQGLNYLFPALLISHEKKNQLSESFILTNIGNAYELLQMHDSALYYNQLAYNVYTGLKHGPLKSLILTQLGNAYLGLGIKDSALAYYRKALQHAYAVDDRVNNSKIEEKMAEMFANNGQYDSSLYYARRSFMNGRQSIQRLGLLETSELLVRLFRQKQNTDSAFFYQDFAKAMADSLYGPQKFRELQVLMLEEQQQQQEIQQDQERYKNKTKMIALWSAVGIFLIIAFILYRNNRHKQKANALLQSQKEKIQNTLSELKSTQSQLIQSEKMASLGELTAGIAHEIQNPLNFVNNFAEVNTELIEEMKEGLKAGKLDDVIALAEDVKLNNEKISHHGKRADSIVKGMLQHSRNSSGQKELTNINTLVDECMRLSYHGLRAKDKTFNAKTEMDLDTNLPKMKIAPQDIGRVILNLFTNAFYSVRQKKKLSADGYEPIVSAKTSYTAEGVSITIHDNGMGIPQKVIDKIFQPFFTTKPVGEGTGLGLSMSYEIITKGHNGELKVETKEGEFATFIIFLPTKS